MGQTTNEIRRRREKYAEQRGKKVIELNKYERRKTSKEVIRKNRRKKRIRAILAALGITVGGVALLTAGNDKAQQPKEPIATENNISKTNSRDEFVNSLSVTNTPEIAQTQEKEDIYQTIVNEYNEQYPDEPINVTDLGILSSNPTAQIYEVDGQYIQDYDLDSETYPDAKLVEDDHIDEYLIINKNSNDVVLAMADISDNGINSQAEYVNVEKYMYNTENGQKIYMGKQITLGDSQNEKEALFNNLEDKYEEVVKAQEEARVNKKLEDLGIEDR